MSNAPPSSSQSGAKKTGKARKLFTLWVHDLHFSPEDLVINPDHFPPDTKIGDIVEIYKPGNKEKALYLAIGAITTIRANLHLSVKDTIAGACELMNREEIVATVVSKETVAVDFAEVTFKDQFISRSDMWRLKMHLKETCAYVGKSIQYSCIRANIRELLSSEQVVQSGYITANTKIVFRSRSAEYMMLFQMSREMWDFAPDGQLYFEKAVNRFLPALFAKWRALGANHCLSMVMFSRTYYDHNELFDLSSLPQPPKVSINASTSPESPVSPTDGTLGGNSPTGPTTFDPPMELCRLDPAQRDLLQRDHEGRYYHDFYTVVCIEERTNWERVVLALKTKFEEYPYMVNWRVPDAIQSKYHSNVLGTNAIAEYSGFLEAINLAQNMLDSRHFVDRDLTRTGQSVVVISAGTGIFIVNPSLEQQTKQRMIDKGIACDLVCVTKPPLHVVPLFIMKRPYQPSPISNPTRLTTPSLHMTPTTSIPSFTNSSPLPNSSATSSFGSSTTSSSATRGAKISFPSHKIAHWVYLFFHDLHVQNEHGGVSRTFTSTCTMPDFLQQNNSSDGIIVPLKLAPNSNKPGEILPAPTNRSESNAPGSAGVHPHHHQPLHHLASHHPPGSHARHNNGRSELTKERSFDSEMVHQMDLETTVTSHAEKMAMMMDDYDSSIFLPPPAAKTRASTTTSNSASGTSTQPSTPSQSKTSGAHHMHGQSLSSLHSPFNSPASHGAMSHLTAPGSGGKRSLQHASTIANLRPSSGRGAAGKGTSSLSSMLGQSNPLGSAHSSSSSSSHLTTVAESPGASGLAVTPSSSVSSSIAHSETTGLLRTPGKGLSSLDVKKDGNSGGQVLELNPFELELKPAPPASNRRRWEHLWARHSIQFDFLESDPSGPHWKSLSQPASLPLTTGYFPAPKELKDNFQFYSHSLDPDESVQPMSLEDHLSEHIAQRLVQGAQIMLPDGASLSATTAQLSAGNAFHQISIKKPNIIVNWYVANNKVWDHERIRYKYFLWTEHTSRRLTKEVDLHYKSIIHYPWNSLDQLLSGYQLEFVDSYNYWNVCMMLVPTDPKMTATQATTGFNKFKEFLSQRMVKLSDPDFGPMKVEIHITPTQAHAMPATDALRSKFSASSPTIPDLIDAHNTHIILSALKDSNLVNEKYFKSEKPDQKTFVFIASKVVDWVVSHVSVRNRTEAIDICASFVANGVFRPVSLPAGSPFRDGANYYVITDATLSSSNVGGGNLSKSSSNHPGSAPTERRHGSAQFPIVSSSSSSHLHITTHSSGANSHRGPLELSSSIPINSDAGILSVPGHQPSHGLHHHTTDRRPSVSAKDGEVHTVVLVGSNPGESTSVLDSDMPFAARTHQYEEYTPPTRPNAQNTTGVLRLAMDPSKTDRFEWVNLIYDTVFDPAVAYEFQFQWLCSTGCVLSDFITQLTRKARSFGFSLCQIPVKHDVQHSFLSPRKDSFSWSELSAVHQRAVCYVLVKVLDFLPRKKPNQFIHRTGVIIIDISNNIFEWTVNWTDVNAYTTAQNFELLKRFRDFMAQVANLKSQSAASDEGLSYSEFVGALLQKVAPFSAHNLLMAMASESQSSSESV